MTLVSSQIPTFSGGVSQQPPSQRLNSQLEEQINGLSSVSKGLQKRPPCEHVAKIYDIPIKNAFLHTINRDENERYLVALLDHDLKVFDLKGNEMIVNFPEGKAYLEATDYRNSFTALTVSDYTFITNKTQRVQMDTATSPQRPHEALIYVKLGNYGKTYSIIINDVVVASYTTPDGTVASHSTYISTDHIAQALYNGLIGYSQFSTEMASNKNNVYTLPSGQTLENCRNVEYSVYQEVSDGSYWEEGKTRWEWSAFMSCPVTWLSQNTFALRTVPGGDTQFKLRVTCAGGTNNPFNAELHGSTIYIQTSYDFRLSTTDGYNNTAMIAIKGKTQKVSDLPTRPGVNGFKACIVGEAGSEDDDFWVSFDMSDSTGVWVEDVAPAVPLRPLASTMPHALIREADGTFTFRAVTWDDRCAGDGESNREPSFIGKTINGMFFFRNRLGILAEDSMILSSAGNYFNFWRTSVKALLDDDPIDAAASHTKVPFLYHAVPYNQQLFLFSEQSQFVLQEADVLSARTTSIKPTTDYPCSKQAVPVSTGKNVYFIADRGRASAVRELYTSTDDNEDATDITAHIPSYIPEGCYKIAQSPTEDILIFMTADTPNTLYVYSYYWSGQQKLQSAWSKWVLPETDNILYGEFINSVFYLAVSRPDGVYLESMKLSLDGTYDEEPYSVVLDRKILASTLPGDGETTPLDIPYPSDGASYQAVSPQGKIWPVFWNGENFFIDGVLPEETKIWFGRQYVFTAELSTLFLTSQGQTGSSTYTGGRLTIRNITVNFADTGYFTVKVIPEGRPEQLKTYTGKTSGTTARVGSHQVTTGSFRVPVMTKNLNTRILIENDSPLPSSLISADWEGDYVTRSQRL